MTAHMFADRRAVWAFALGCLAVTAGVLLHLPMFLMGKAMGYRLAGMAMDAGMLWGMALILGGTALATYGLLPRHRAQTALDDLLIEAPEDAPLSLAHWGLKAALTAALVIDTMKPASLGFVVPGMIVEYQVSPAAVAWLPFSALAGTVLGSMIWGVLSDVFGRRAAILLSAVMFVGTSICGAMPSLWWNVAMCFTMGAAAGGMLPVAYALLSEAMPTRHRGWSLVLVGGLGMAGGYLAASFFSGLLQPHFGWRIMWFLNLPTGLLMVLLNDALPESPRFLLHMGRREEAAKVMRRFGARVRRLSAEELAQQAETDSRAHPAPAERRGLIGRTAALSLTAIAWGLVNFGLLLWLPADMARRGYSMEVTGRLLALSALIALPTVFVGAALYALWSSKRTLIVAITITGLGLLAVLALESGRGPFESPVVPVALLIIGSNGVLAMLLPYAAESYPLHIRGRATGWIAGASKMGGLGAQALSLLGVAPALGHGALLIAAPVALAILLVGRFGAETRGRDLRELDAEPAPVAA